VREEGRGEGERDGGGVVDAEVGEVLAQPARGVGERVWAGQRRAVGQLGPGPRAGRSRASARGTRAPPRGWRARRRRWLAGTGRGGGWRGGRDHGSGEQRRGGRGHGGRRPTRRFVSLCQRVWWIDLRRGRCLATRKNEPTLRYAAATRDGQTGRPGPGPVKPGQNRAGPAEPAGLIFCPSPARSGLKRAGPARLARKNGPKSGLNGPVSTF
jgi:hypothetical protein